MPLLTFLSFPEQSEGIELASLDLIKKYSELNITPGSQVTIPKNSRTVNKHGEAKVTYMVQLDYHEFPAPKSTPNNNGQVIAFEEKEGSIMRQAVTYKTYGDFKRLNQKVMQSELNISQLPMLPPKKTNQG